MTRSELAARLAALAPHIRARDAEGALDAILDRIADALSSGERVELRDFGAFTVKQRAARTGRNPRTGATVAVAAKAEVAFKPGKAIRARLIS